MCKSKKLGNPIFFVNLKNLEIQETWKFYFRVNLKNLEILFSCESEKLGNPIFCVNPRNLEILFSCKSEKLGNSIFVEIQETWKFYFRVNPRNL